MTPKFNEVFPLTKRKIADQRQILVLAENSGRILLARKPPIVGEGIWGMWEDVRTESGYTGNIKFIRKSQMKYNIGRYSFISVLGVVPSEFIPSLGDGVENYQWALSEQLSSLKLHDNLKIYIKAIHKSLEQYYKDFINETGQGGNVTMGTVPRTVT